MQTSTQSEPLEDVEGSHELSMATNHLNVEEEVSGRRFIKWNSRIITLTPTHSYRSMHHIIQTK